MSQAKIRLQLGGMPREYTLPRDPGAVFIIGRGKDANLQFESTPEFSYISNRHCHIRFVGDGYVIIDGSVDGKPSSAGTFVNGQQIFNDGKILASNDEIRLGNLAQSVKIQFTVEQSSFDSDYMATNIQMQKPPTPLTSQPPVVSPPPAMTPPPVPVVSPPPQNPFGSTPVTNPYGVSNPGQPPNPYGQPQQPPNPYGQPQQPPNPYGQPQQPPNPYGQPQQPPNPYGQPQQPPNPYGQPQQPPNPYGQPQQPPNPYGQPPQNPYGQPQMGYNQYGQPQMGYGGYPPVPSRGFPVMGLIISVISGAIFFALYQFISLELLISALQGNGVDDQNLLIIIPGVVYTIAFILTGFVLSQMLKPMSVITMAMVALAVGIITTIAGLIGSSSTSGDTIQLLDWMGRIGSAFIVALILSNFNKLFGANGEPRLSFVFMMIVAILWVVISWGTNEMASNILTNASDISQLRLTRSLIGMVSGAAISALLFLALKFSNSPLQKGGGQPVMYQQQPPYNQQYPPYR